MSVWSKYLTMIRADIKAAMANRCGLDELNNFIMLIGFLFVVVALLTKNWIFTLIGAIFIVLCYVRVFSKNLVQRKKENAFYMRYMGNVVGSVKYFKVNMKMRAKTMEDPEHYYFVCNACGQMIRLPKGKNKVSVRCPKCSKTFIKRT